MLVDTHCHMNMMVKKTFDVLLTTDEIIKAAAIVHQAKNTGVSTIINVGTYFMQWHLPLVNSL